MTRPRTIDILGRMKRRVIISLVIFCIVVGAALYFKNRPDAKSSKTQADLVVEKLADTLLARDNEKGQFKTWEELYGSTTSATSTDGQITAPKYTSTDLFSQEIFKEYLAQKQAGVEITPELSGQIAENVLTKNYPTDEAKMVSKTDIKTEDATYLNFVAYANALIQTVMAPLPGNSDKSEMELLQEIAGNPDLLGTVDFQPFLDRYTAMKKALLRMSVPESVAQAHVNIINGVSNLILATQGMASLETDPIGGLGKTAAYTTGLDLLDVGFGQVKAQLKASGVFFSPDEPAYPFFI